MRLQGLLAQAGDSSKRCSDHCCHKHGGIKVVILWRITQGGYPDNSFGLMQINMLDEPGYMLGAERRQKYGITNEDLKDPLTNLKVAKDIWDTQGPNAWSLYKHGIYKKICQSRTQYGASLRSLTL